MLKGRLIILLVLFAHLAFAADNQQIIRQANKVYSAGEYKMAASLYEKVINSGFTAPELYYNLGNAYFKMNELPSAILYYEKARKLKPNDDYIETNLKISNAKIIDKIEPVPVLFYKRWWKSLQIMFSLNGWAAIIITGTFLFLALLAIYLISGKLMIRKISFWSSVIVFVLTFFSFGLAYHRYRIIQTEQEAIIFTPSITIKSSPDENSTDLFVIHEGTKVSITDHVNDWLEIKIANGNVGWVKNDVLKTI